MTRPHVHCMSHLPTAHEQARPSGPAPVSPSGASLDERPAASLSRPLNRLASPAAIGPMSSSLPGFATCVIPMLR